MNSHWLKSSKFIKFLKDSGLIKQGVLQNHNLKKGNNTGNQENNQPNNRANRFKQLTTVQADLIFKKLTGLEKPKGHPLVSMAITRQRPQSGNPSSQQRKGQQAMDFTKFVKSLALVGSEVYSVPSKGFEIVTVNAMITNTLVELDKQIGASERGMNTNASS